MNLAFLNHPLGLVFVPEQNLLTLIGNNKFLPGKFVKASALDKNDVNFWQNTAFLVDYEFLTGSKPKCDIAFVEYRELFQIYKDVAKFYPSENQPEQAVFIFPEGKTNLLEKLEIKKGFYAFPLNKKTLSIFQIENPSAFEIVSIKKDFVCLFEVPINFKSWILLPQGCEFEIKIRNPYSRRDFLCKITPAGENLVISDFKPFEKTNDEYHFIFKQILNFFNSLNAMDIPILNHRENSSLLALDIVERYRENIFYSIFMLSFMAWENFLGAKFYEITSDIDPAKLLNKASFPNPNIVSLLVAVLDYFQDIVKFGDLKFAANKLTSKVKKLTLKL
ncbi:MAG: hypothetical protein QW228_03460 [Candidatus Aenigmatarchaeota archaeon]